MTRQALHAACATQVLAGAWFVAAIALDWPLRVLVASVAALALSSFAVSWVRGEMLRVESLSHRKAADAKLASGDGWE